MGAGARDARRIGAVLLVLGSAGCGAFRLEWQALEEGFSGTTPCTVDRPDEPVRFDVARGCLEGVCAGEEVRPGQLDALGARCEVWDDEGLRCRLDDLGVEIKVWRGRVTRLGGRLADGLPLGDGVRVGDPLSCLERRLGAPYLVRVLPRGAERVADKAVWRTPSVLAGDGSTPTLLGGAGGDGTIREIVLGESL